MSDYNFLMESRLSPEQYAVLALISRLAIEQGLNLYLVGGAVRDLTQGQQVVRDLDFVITGTPQRLLRVLPNADSLKSRRSDRETAGEPALAVEYYDLDERLNTCELLFSNGVRAEIGMSREEIYSHPGQRPEVRPATVFEDLKRRDFAINAMAVSLHPNSRGLLLDPTNGAGDIERHEIRALQSRGFLDDPSRIYRMLRLAMRLELKPDERTQRWFDAAVEEKAWERLDAGQQARELAAILHEDQPGRILKVLSERKILAGLDKKLASAHLPYDRFARIRSVLQSAPGADPFLLNFHSLVDKVSTEHKAYLAKKIIREDKAIKIALGFERESAKVERALSGAKANLPSQVYTLLAPHPQALLLYLLTNTKSAKVQNRIKSFLFKFPEVHAQLPRTELQALGVKAGPEFDRIISRIFALQLDGKIKSHQQLMKEMRALAGIKEPPPPPPPPVPSPKKGKEAHHESAAGHAGKKGKEALNNLVAMPAPAVGKEAAKTGKSGASPAAAKSGARPAATSKTTAAGAPHATSGKAAKLERKPAHTTPAVVQHASKARAGKKSAK